MGPGRDEPQAEPPPGKLLMRITSLEMLTESARTEHAAPPVEALSIQRARHPTVAFYRFLYDKVGEAWLWTDRRRWSDAELAETVQDTKVEIWVLWAGGQPAGYAELDRRVPGEVELAYFGLLPQFIGRGLGSRLLHFAIRTAWANAPWRLWVHTCNFDHPSALGLYERHGFVAYRTDEQFIYDPRVLGLVPRHAAPQHPIAWITAERPETPQARGPSH